MAIVSNSNLEDKLKWAFSLYDLNNNGYITKDELLAVYRSVYSLVKDSDLYQEELLRCSVEDRVDRVFDLIDEVQSLSTFSKTFRITTAKLQKRNFFFMHKTMS